MKKFLIVLVVLVLFVSCSQPKKISFPDGSTKTIAPYGIFNQEEKNPNVVYQISTNDVIVSIIFSETVVVPIISCGWNLWEPVEAK